MNTKNKKNKNFFFLIYDIDLLLFFYINIIINQLFLEIITY
jgi:hypothetical protein